MRFHSSSFQEFCPYFSGFQCCQLVELHNMESLGKSLKGGSLRFRTTEQEACNNFIDCRCREQFRGSPAVQFLCFPDGITVGAHEICYKRCVQNVSRVIYALLSVSVPLSRSNALALRLLQPDLPPPCSQGVRILAVRAHLYRVVYELHRRSFLRFSLQLSACCKRSFPAR